MTQFHPRSHQWTDHFRIEADRIIGLTDIGRTTVFLLEMNADQRVDLRLINHDEAGGIAMKSFSLKNLAPF